MPFKRLVSSALFRVRNGWHTYQKRNEVPRADNPYATCIPVLVGLSRILPVTKVLEFGAGVYSTSLFLNHKAFDSLEKLYSFENDGAWAKKVLEVAGQDKRLVLECLDLPMYQIVDKTSLDGRDLIFIDDSNNASDRSLTIRSVLKRINAPTVVAIHDFEVPQYQQAVDEYNLTLQNKFIFDALTPNTCVLWEGREVYKSSFAGLNKVIARFAKDLSPHDISGWIEAFDRSRQARRWSK